MMILVSLWMILILGQEKETKQQAQEATTSIDSTDIKVKKLQTSLDSLKQTFEEVKKK